MITCSTLKWEIGVPFGVGNEQGGKRTTIWKKTLSGIPENFSGKLLEVPVGTGHSDHAGLSDYAGGRHHLPRLLGGYDGAGTGKGGAPAAAFYVMSEHKRTDWFVRRVYEKTGFFTPPYEMAFSLKKRLDGMYADVDMGKLKSMAWFVCRKAG